MRSDPSRWSESIKSLLVRNPSPCLSSTRSNATSNGRAELLVVGLGNPGPRYSRTRHNVGFGICDQVVTDTSGYWKAGSSPAIKALVYLDSHLLEIVKPQTFVNCSGIVVRNVLRRHGLGPERLVVVHDDIDLRFGNLRVRYGGSSGGHRGIKSIITALDSDKFLRIKIGVGRPPQGVDPAAFVLEPFTATEQPVIDMLIARAALAIRGLVLGNQKEVMQEFNAPNAS